MKHVILIFLVLFSTRAGAVRLKDIGQLRGARDNQLVGYGIVVGLAGTGDKTLDLTEGSLANVLKGLGADVKSQRLDTRNAAAVVASATLPPFSRAGTRLDVHVSSVGTSASLEGGTLMMTALKGADGTVYAIAQGKVITQRKIDAQGRATTGGNLASALLPGGALIEREVPFDFQNQRDVRWVLGNPDFTTAVRIAKKIDEELGGKYATASDAATIDVILPYQFEASPVELIAQIESLDIDTDIRAKVVINSRTGTVVLGEQVRVAPVAIAHGNLKIEVEEANRNVSSDAEGEGTADAPAKKAHKVIVMNKGTNIADIVSSLNAMGASSDDLVSMMQALKASGALMAELEMQ